MVGGVLYYIILFIFSLSLGIYNYYVFMIGKDITCYVIIPPSQIQEILNTTNFSISTYNSKTNTCSHFDLLSTTDGKGYEKRENVFKILSLTIAICYLIIASISFTFVFIINNMSNMLPEDFVNMSKCKKSLGFLTKTLPPICVIIHYVIFLGILALWVFYVNGSCLKLLEPKCQKFDTRYNHRLLVLNIVNSIFWVLIHYMGSIIRDVLYQEPFMYSRTVTKPKIIYKLFKNLGP